MSCLVNLLLLVPAVHMLTLYEYVLTSGSYATLVFLSGFMVFLLICKWGLDHPRHLLAGRIGQRLSLNLQSWVFSIDYKSSNLHQPPSQTSLVDDCRQIRKFLGSSQLFAFIDAPWVPVYLVVEYLLHPLLGVVATIITIITFLLALLVEIRSRWLTNEERHFAINERQFRSALSRGASVVEAHGMDLALYRYWNGMHDKMLSLEDKISARLAFWTTLSKTFRMCAQVVILSLGAWLVLQEEIIPAVMIVASIVMSRALAPVEQCIGAWRPFVSFRHALTRIRKALDVFPPQSSRLDITPVKLTNAKLEIIDITASPPGLSSAVLKGINLTVKPGIIVQILGKNGSGKSTLLKVIAGVWKPMSGKVFVGGVDVHHWDSLDRGRHFGFLPQPPMFFPGSVKDNITGWDNNLAQLRSAVRLAGSEEAFNSLSNHLDTPLVDGGENVSMGMRQRIGLARAIYGNPEIIILDEPETGLDDQGRKALLNLVKNLKDRGTIVLVVSHLSLLTNLADQIFVLEGGRVVAHGPREKFINKLPATKSRATRISNSNDKN